MNDMIEAGCRETHGRTSPHTPRCKHDCQACLTDFEQTQLQVEQLRADLLQETADNQQLWLEARSTLRRTLLDLVPAPRMAGVPGESSEFLQGWERCRSEVERRIQELAKVL